MTGRRQNKISIFKIISLNSCIYSSLIFLLQVYLIIIQVKCLILNDVLLLNEQDYAIFLIFLIISMLITIINLFINSIRIGSYTHDCVKLGHDFNLYLSNKLSTLVLKGENESNRISRVFLTNKIWKNFLPIGQIFHLIAAFCLLYNDIISYKSLIQLQYLPIGDIFSTKLDFLFGDPINRIKFIRNDDHADKNQTNLLKSIDDFGNLNEYNSNKLISWNFLNLVIALVVFVMKLSQTFWHTNRLVSVLILFYSTILSILCLISYASFEIMFKFDVLIIQYKLNISLIFKNNLLAFINILTISLYFISCFIYIHFSFKKYENLVVKFEENLFKYFNLNVSTFEKSETKQHEVKKKATPGSSNTEIESTSTESSSYSSISEQISDKGTKLTCKKETPKNNIKFSLCLYKDQIFLSVLFLIYSLIRSLFIYQQLVVYKFCKDKIILTSIIIEFVAIMIWIAGLLLITIKTNWKFNLRKNYKIVNWNWFYDYEVRSKHEYKKFSNTIEHATNSNVETNVLYVRDDSVLNKSLDSSGSNSEVSYMPVILSSANASTTTNNMSSNTSNASESATSGNSFSTISNNTISNILDADKLKNLCKKQQILTQHEIEALYSKPQRISNFETMKENLNKNLAQSFDKCELMTDKYKTIVENKNEMEGQNYSRCIILRNENPSEENNQENKFVNKRSLSQRLPKTISFDTHIGLMNQTSFRNNLSSKTVFDSKESQENNSEKLKRGNSSSIINQPKPKNSITKTVLFVDSSSPTDSGRDSLNESPVSSKQQSLKIINSSTKTKAFNNILDTNC